MDRKEALFFYLLFVAGAWVTILTDSILTQKYASLYGQQVLVFFSCGAIIVGAIGILVYARWPQTPKPIPIQEVRLPTSVLAEPSLKVEIYQAIIVPEQGAPSKRIYFQVTNVGKSTASHCRAIIRLPDQISPYMRSLSRLPPAPKAYETTQRLLANIELDWFKAGMTPPEDKYCLGKSVDISPHPNDVFLAGTVLANKVELGPVHTVNAKLEISVNTPDNWPPKGRIWRPLMELYAGDPLEIKTVFTWEKEQIQERTFRWELRVVSFDDIRCTLVS